MGFCEAFEKLAKLRKSVELLPHQERVKEKLDISGGVLVYHGLGSGKTLTGIAATQDYDTDVIVPASLRGNFNKEVLKHTTDYSPNVMSYEKAIKTIPQGEVIIVDEVHNIGHSESKKSKAIQAFASEYSKRLALTATPIRNYPHELAPLLRFVRNDKEIPLDRKAFDKKYIKAETIDPSFFGKLLHGAQPGTTYKIKNAKKLSDLVKGYVDYYAPESEHFPSVTQETIDVPMSPEQMEYYNYVMGKASPALRYKIKEGLPPSKTEAKQLNTFLSGVRQVSNSTKSFGGVEDSPKLKRALDELTVRQKSDPNFKALIYSNFLDSGVNSYSKLLNDNAIPHHIFSGELSDKQRKKVVEDYNDGNVKALLITGAGSQGLDLKGTKLVQLLEPYWNENRLAQASGRAARYMSHTHLPKEERAVHIQKFHSSVPQSNIGKFLGRKNDMSSDQYLSLLSDDKEKLNNQFLDVLKRVGSQ